MNETLILVTVIICAALVVYQHVGYPLLLHWYARLHPLQPAALSARGYQVSSGDKQLPGVTILMPAYNEAAFIAEKIRNLASIDYPRDKLKVIIVCDGCSDNTAEVARSTIQEAICADTLYEIIEWGENMGKVAVLNSFIPQIDTEVCALTDVSALISVDALLHAAGHLRNPANGVVSASYQLLSQRFTGESQYWRYQQQIKLAESRMGSALGCHGAFYLFRSELFEPLDSDTINDDFILPMRIVEKQYRAIYEPAMLAIELESTDQPADFQRRLRISAGNMQQMLRLWRLFSPRNLGLSFTFFSGKALRVLTPYLLLALLLLPALQLESLWYQLLFGAQCLFYLTSLAGLLIPRLRNNKIAGLVTYFVAGHSASHLGGWQYLLGPLSRRKTI
jgi:cellulose synthase/poly-beta-1,6-N-acetylglucosamine synthase-like glycosyltransferase